MVSHERWEAECLLMVNNFPQFTPFAESGTIGFRGRLRGPRSGRAYAVNLRASAYQYPQVEPGVYMHPHPESHHWIGDGRLCFERDRKSWNPARSTFANLILIAAKYLAEFDGR